MCGASGGVYALIGAHLAAIIMARLFLVHSLACGITLGMLELHIL